MKPERCIWIGVVVAVLTFMVQQPATPLPPGPDSPVVVTPPPNQPPTPGSPVSFDGKYVIVVDESGDATRETSARLTADPAVQQYLAAHCTGGVRGWRRWDDQVPLANAPAPLREMMGLPRAGLPCVVVAADRRARVLPLSSDATPEQFIAALTPFLGP